MNKTIFCAGLLLALTSCGGGGGAPSTTSSRQTDPTPGADNRVYFAGPMFNAAEKRFNLTVTTLLEEAGYDVFLPQRDGIEGAALDGKTEEEMIEMIFPLDVEEVKRADILFMNLDGRVPDEGACVELGIAYASGKRCYGFKTDTHAAERTMDLNPMISGCMRKIFRNYDGEALLEEIAQYLTEYAL